MRIDEAAKELVTEYLRWSREREVPIPQMIAVLGCLYPRTSAQYATRYVIKAIALADGSPDWRVRPKH